MVTDQTFRGMAKFKLSDKHAAFCSAIASGEFAYKAYMNYVASRPTTKKSAEVSASNLLARPEIQDLIQQAKKERQLAIVKAQAGRVAEEFETFILATDQLDAYHSAIIQGKVVVEEIYPVTTITRDKTGKEVERTVAFKKVARQPNLREKQISIDALYRRRGDYAAVKGLFGIGRVDQDEDDSGDRFIVLSNGERIKL
jgi:hypothetical protein